MAKELEKVPAIAHSNKSNKTVSTKNTSKTDSTKKATFNADANTLKEMQENVTVLQQKLNGLDVHSDQFKEVAKDIDFWKRKIEDVNRGFELGSITDYEKQIKRSEEHTSELQSRQYLVCRLLLEKKKK